MVGIVDFLHEIGHSELQLIQPQTTCFVAGSKLQPRTQKKQDSADLPANQLACLEERRSKWRALVAHAVHHSHYAVHAARFARHVFVARARVLKRKPHKFAAALDLGPVKELITHGSHPASWRALRKLRPRCGLTSRGGIERAWIRRTDFSGPTTRLRPAAFAS